MQAKAKELQETREQLPLGDMAMWGFLSGARGPNIIGCPLMLISCSVLAGTLGFLALQGGYFTRQVTMERGTWDPNPLRDLMYHERVVFQSTSSRNDGRKQPREEDENM